MESWFGNRSLAFRNAGKALTGLAGASDPLRQGGEVLGNTLVGLCPWGLWEWQRVRGCSVGAKTLFFDGTKVSPELTVEQVIRFEQAWKELQRSGFRPPGFLFCPRDILETRQRYDLVRLAIALEQYALENGAYPERLEELVLEWMPSIPADRFDPSREVGYERTADGRYRLVAVGGDGIDSGGRDDDLVWEYPGIRETTGSGVDTVSEAGEAAPGERE